MTASGRTCRDGQASTFDDEPDHGLSDERTREALEAWVRLFRPGGRLVLIEGHWLTTNTTWRSALAE